jgi:hypothetical protein
MELSSILVARTLSFIQNLIQFLRVLMSLARAMPKPASISMYSYLIRCKSTILDNKKRPQKENGPFSTTTLGNAHPPTSRFPKRHQNATLINLTNKRKKSAVRHSQACFQHCLSQNNIKVDKSRNSIFIN